MIQPDMRPKPGPIRLHNQIRHAIRRALQEDVGDGDITTDSIVPAYSMMRGVIVAKQSGVIAGLDVAHAVYLEVDVTAAFEPAVEEGARVEPGQTLAELSGQAATLLTAERTALNFLGRMSGIATLTRQFVDAVAGTRAVILDTRKTAPGLRMVDKLAVERGGGSNHRIGLFDMVLIKDNHIDFAGSITEAVKRVRAELSGVEVEVEARTLQEVQEALDLGIGRIMLDNMPLDSLREAVRLAGGRARLEASGNVSLESARGIAETGVDFISVGALTHSAKNFDLSFEYTRPGATLKERR
jgi:nicotinate-nucleotide pyrophosphorylase (carboxylating)